MFGVWQMANGFGTAFVVTGDLPRDFVFTTVLCLLVAIKTHRHAWVVFVRFAVHQLTAPWSANFVPVCEAILSAFC